MITQNISDCQTPTWQIELANAISDPAELCAELGLDATWVSAALGANKSFQLRVPRGFVKRMRKGDPQDPLLLQVLPQFSELQLSPGFVQDSLLENQANPLPGSGLLHKYKNRVLLIVTGACAINCRYCFRRHFPYLDNNFAGSNWDQAMDYIAKDSNINEVILSGGDPLVMKDLQLQKLIEKLANIPQIKRLRIHTRLPIVIPARITQELVDVLTKSRLQPVIVVHANHANEIDVSVKTAMQRLRNANITILNQTVLLKGINDNADALITLSETLFDAGIIPYYLHMLDKVQGAAHFEVEENKAKQLYWEMLQRLSGYLAPKLVREQPGMPAKLPVTFLES